MITLNETIKNKQPIKVFIRDDEKLPYEYYDTMTYNKELDRYEGNYGNIPFKKIPMILAKKKEVDHIKLEVIDKN